MALLTELEDKISSLIDGVDKENFIYDFMREMGIPKSTVTKLKKGTKTANMATVPGDIWSNKNVYYRQTSKNVLAEFTDVKSIVDSKQGNTPRIIMVTDFSQLLALDTKTSDTLDIAFNDLPLHFDFFLPWQGIEKVDYEAENPADIKAAERFAKIYDVLFQDNTEIVTVKEGRKTAAKHVFSENTVNETAFNNFLIRALFALFAEDTDIFPRGSFTNVLKTMTSEDGSNMNSVLSELFTVLDQPENMRGDLANWLNQFPYVNGSLFTEPHEDIVFSAKSRKLIIDAGELIDWTQVNPDIFGSMVQAVTGEDDRSHLGMHYTSVPNIMKVIKPLFLDDLNAEFEAAYDSEKKLNELNDRMSRMKFFDPAAGSGNFLIITYKELRRLEIKVMKRLAELTGSLLYVPIISLKQFYGIEIEEFATDVAKLSLWIAEHQMNVELRKELNGVVRPTLPLQNAGDIHTGNSLAINWIDFVNAKDGDETIIIGNPPYVGHSKMNASNKEDIQKLFPNLKGNGYLDYISGWFKKGARFINETNASAKIAFVTTNSINQGEQVGILWPNILEQNVEIAFAYQSFKWGNNAKNNAGVTVSIIGLAANGSSKAKLLFTKDGVKQVKNINPYLIEGPDITVRDRKQPLGPFPPMLFGNKPTDGGGLILDINLGNQMREKYPELQPFIKKFVGSADLINGEYRYVIWFNNIDEYQSVKNNPFIQERIAIVKSSRLASDTKSTNQAADRPWQFKQIAPFHKEVPTGTHYNIVVPRVSSEARKYVPMAMVNQDTIISDAAMAVFDAPLWLLAVLESKMHMVWLAAVGGKLETRFRYSSGLVYNTFPLTKLTQSDIDRFEEMTMDLIDTREEIGGSLADLYGKNMDERLVRVHEKIDLAVDKLFGGPFKDDDDRLKMLFKKYLELTNG